VKLHADYMIAVATKEKGKYLITCKVWAEIQVRNTSWLRSILPDAVPCLPSIMPYPCGSPPHQFASRSGLEERM
jgi:hypothetical protein